MSKKLYTCKFCGKPPSSHAASLWAKGTSLKCWIVECDVDEDSEEFPFAEHRITVYGANQKEAEKRWEEINGK